MVQICSNQLCTTWSSGHFLPGSIMLCRILEPGCVVLSIMIFMHWLRSFWLKAAHGESKCLWTRSKFWACPVWMHTRSRILQLLALWPALSSPYLIRSYQVWPCLMHKLGKTMEEKIEKYGRNPERKLWRNWVEIREQTGEKRQERRYGR